MPKPTHADERSNAAKAETKFRKPDICSVAVCSAIAMYEQELERHCAIEASLGESVLRGAQLLRQKDELLRQKDVLAKETEHRLLNGMQLIRSVLAMQSRSAVNPETAQQLSAASKRVAAIALVHQYLHAMDAIDFIEFKGYLERLCSNLSDMVSTENGGLELLVQGAEMTLPRMTASPLAFIASELITNSMKYARGKITINLEWLSNGEGVLSVSDDGAGLPETFDPAATHGLGMKIIDAFARQVQGELTFGKGDHDLGARFSLRFKLQTSGE